MRSTSYVDVRLVAAHADRQAAVRRAVKTPVSACKQTLCKMQHAAG